MKRKLESIIDWEIFRKPIEQALYVEPKGLGGRVPFEKLMMFKNLILQKYYNNTLSYCEYCNNSCKEKLI